MRFKLSIIAGVISCFFVGTYYVNQISLNQNCIGYLKRAADANSIELAKRELEKTIFYAEKNGLTNGYTSVLYKTPDEDIEFWYKNLKSSLDEIDKLDSTTTQMEKSNILMKLRETLTDSSTKGLSLTYPKGLSRYPNNLLWGIFIFISVCCIIWFIIELLIYLDRNR